MAVALLFSLIGYLSGSILYANVFGKLFKKNNFLNYSKDHNPGTANAYKYGGFWCGTLTLCGDVLKGFIPVYLATFLVPNLRATPMYALILAAPVLGHAFSIFLKFNGGKGIATSFGCLLGIFPYILPFSLFVVSFLFFSVILRITPHFYRTIIAYISTFILLIFLRANFIVCTGFLIILLAVFFRLYLSKEEKEKVKVKIAWMR